MRQVYPCGLPAAMHRTVGEWLITVARASLLALVIFSAAAYGLTRDWTIEWFNIAAGMTFGGWLLGHLIALRRPATGFLPWLLVALILAFGWAVTGLGYANEWLIEAEQEFPEHYYEIAAWGTFLFADSLKAMTRTSALLALFLIVIDTFADPRWGRALLLTLAATAVGMVVFFFLQRAFGKPFLIRDVFERHYLSFATYRYWGNAASFLGLLWPLVAAVAVTAAVRKALGWSLWMGAAILVFGALYINKSKAGHVLGIAGLLLFGLLVLIQLSRSGVLRRLQLRSATIAIVLLPLLAIGTALYFAIPQERWDRFATKGLEENPRSIAFQYFLGMVPTAGWQGYGPGTFATAHRPFIENDNRVRKTPFWVAHQDYLQTVIEWGYAGTALWGLLFVPAGIRLLARGACARPGQYREAERECYGWDERLARLSEGIPAPSHPLIQMSAFTAIMITAFHAMVDFPMQIESLQFYFLIWIALGWTPLREKVEDR